MNTYAVAFLLSKTDGNNYITSITLHERQALNENEAIGNAISSAFKSKNGFSVDTVLCLQIGGTNTARLSDDEIDEIFSNLPEPDVRNPEWVKTQRRLMARAIENKLALAVQRPLHATPPVHAA